MPVICHDKLTWYLLRSIASEVTLLTYAGLSQEELVAMLRSRARKNGAHVSVYNGVSLIRQTGKWHAQIDIEGNQVTSHFKQAWFHNCAATIFAPACKLCQVTCSHHSVCQTPKLYTVEVLHVPTMLLYSFCMSTRNQLHM